MNNSNNMNQYNYQNNNVYPNNLQNSMTNNNVSNGIYRNGQYNNYQNQMIQNNNMINNIPMNNSIKQNNAVNNGQLNNNQNSNMIFFSLQDGKIVNNQSNTASEGHNINLTDPNVTNSNKPGGPIVEVGNDVWVSNKYKNIGISYGEVSDEELLRAFIGGDSFKIRRNIFNFAGFLFSFLYMFYRKLYLAGVITSIIYLFSYLFLFQSRPYLLLIFNVIIGFTINKIHVLHAKIKIKEIRTMNMHRLPEEIKTICVVKGGADIKNVFGGLLLNALLVVVAIFVLPIIGLSSVLEPYNPVIEEAKVKLKDVFTDYADTFQTPIQYDHKYKVKNYFLVYVPSVFKDNSTSYNYKYTYSSSDVLLNACKFSFNAVKKQVNAADFIKELKEYNINNNSSDIAKIIINDREWYTFSFDSLTGRMDYYTTAINDKVFLMEFEKEENAPDDCYLYRDKIINSVISE